MSINKYAFVLTEDQTYNFYKVENGRSNVLATGIKDPTIKVTIRTVQKPVERARTMALRSAAIMPLELEGEDEFIEEQQMDIETSPEEPGFFSALFDDICGGISDAVSWVKDGVMTLFSPSEEQVEQAKQVEQASKKAVEATQAKKIAVNGVATPFFQTIEQAIGKVPNRKTVADLTTNSILYSASTATLCYPSDLLADDNPYNGLYTVFFISEHQQSTIVKAEDGAYTTNTKYVNNQGSSFAKTMSGLSPKEQAAIQIAAGLGGAYAAVKTATSAAGQVLNVVSSGSGPESNGNFVKRMGVGAIGVAATAALATPIVSTVMKTMEDVKTQGIDNAMINAVQKSALTQNNLDFKQLKIAIALPTPKISIDSELKLSDAKMALSMGLTRAAADLIKNGASGDILAGADKANANTSFSDLYNSFQAKVKDKVNTSVDLINEGATALATSNPKMGGIISRMTGTTANTRKEMLFEDVEFRTYTFSYQLMARSPEEMQSIESIIRVFKYHAYPELSKSEFLYRYPAQFDIVHYFNDSVNSHMPRHATCVLTKIDVDYSGGQQFMSVHYDGSPVSISLSLTFREIAVLNKDSIAKGY